MKPCAVSAAAARSRRCAGAGSVNGVAGDRGGHGVSWAVLVSLDDVFVSAVRQRSPSECEATRQPHIPVRCLVELVRADATEGAGDTMTTRSGPGARPARSGPGRDHERAASADQSRLPAARLPGRGRGRRAGDLRPLVRHVPAAAGGHRIPRRLADDGRQPHLPQPARLGPGPAGALRGRMDPRAAARTHGVDQRAAGRHHGRPGRPGHPRRVGQHGLPRRARIDDPGRARRVHPARRLPLPLRRGGRDRRPYAGGLPPAGLLGPPPHPRRAGSRDPDQPGRPASSGTSSRPGKPRTSTPSSACSTPTPRRSPTAAASPRPSCAPSKAASRSRAPGSRSPTGRPAT